jgi:hypothetical protein
VVVAAVHARVLAPAAPKAVVAVDTANHLTGRKESYTHANAQLRAGTEC